MKERGKFSWMLVLVGALAAGGYVLTQERSRGKTPTLSEDAHVVWLNQQRATVERLLGQGGRKWPVVQPTTGQAFHQLSDADALAHLRWQFPHLQGEALQHAAAAVNRCLNQAALARRAEGADGLLIYASNAAVMASWHPSLAKASDESFLRLALVHETFRWILDQSYDLTRRCLECRDAEEWRALVALSEGRALFLTRQFAQKLQWEEYLPLLTERYLHVPDVSTDPGIRTLCQSALRQRHWAALQGLAFWDHVAQQGWPDTETQVFTQPPRLAEWIAKPELYVRAAQARRADLAAELARLEQALPAGQWQARQQPWTPAMVSQVANLLGESNRATKVLAAWEEGRSLVWMNRANPGQLIALSLARLETAAAARAYFGFILDLQRKRDDFARNPCGLSLRVLESRSKALSLPGMDEAVAADKKVQPANGGQAVPVSVLLARSGTQVMELTWHGLDGNQAWAEQVLTALGSRK